jgi:hypothetical protein
MSNQLKHTELIDAYLTGNLSSEESSRLMQLLEQDPALKEEFDLQQDLVNSLREHRRMQLKARLDNIEVGTGYSMPSAATLKLIAGAALVGALSVGSWFAYNQLQESTDHTAYTEETRTEQPEAKQAWNTEAHTAEPQHEESLPVNPESSEESISSSSTETASSEPSLDQKSAKENPGYSIEDKRKEEQPATKNTASSAVSAAEQAHNSAHKSSETAAKAGQDKESTSLPEVVKPEVVSFFEEPDAVDSVPEANAPKDQLNEVHSFSTQNIEVTTRSDKQYPFHYMFHDNQLHIYGDFSQVPYEVLEVNSGNQTRYYLYHGGGYYELNPNQRKVTRLKELTNEKIIQELEITRTQKLNR